MAELLESGKAGWFGPEESPEAVQEGEVALEKLPLAVWKGLVDSEGLLETVEQGETQPEARSSPTPTLVNSPMKSQKGRCRTK